MSCDIEKKLNEFEAGLSERDKKIAALEADKKKLEKQLEGPATGWGGVAETVTISNDPNAPAPQRAKRGLPAGWKRESHFGSLGKMLQHGVKNRHNPGNIYQGFDKAYNTNAGFSKAIQGMNEGIGTDGGLWIVPEYSQTIMEHVFVNDHWSKTDNYIVTGNSMRFLRSSEASRANGSRHGGIRGYWGAEGATLTKSNPTFDYLTMNLHKLHVLVYLTDELVEDAPALESYVTKKVGEEFNFLLSDALFNGTGAGQPTGVLASANAARISVAKETGQSATTLLTENIDKMWMRVHTPSKSRGEWYHHNDCNAQLDALAQDVGTGGLPMARTDVTSAPRQTLKGRPRTETEFNATLGTQGDIAFCDLSQYITIGKGGIAQAQSMHVEFLTDQLALRFTMRVDGQPWEKSALTPYKGSTTTSAFVVLDTRS